MQGTLLPYGSHKDLQTIVKRCLYIEGREIEFDTAEKHENDHYIPSPVSDAFNTRNSVKSQDESLTMRIPKKLHAKRTNDPVIRGLKYRVDDLGAPLHRVLKPLPEADKALWMKPEHNSDILEAGLTPEYMVAQSGRAFTSEVVRMETRMYAAGFQARQATAFLIDGGVQTAMTVSQERFLTFQPAVPSIRQRKNLTKFQRSSAANRYRDGVKEYNLPALTELFGHYINISQGLEQYSTSPKGIEEGCTPHQTKRHRQRKWGIVRVYARCLERSGVKPEIAERELSTFQSTFDQGEARLTADQAINMVTTSVDTIELNSMSRRGGVFSMALPPRGFRENLYVKCQDEAERAAKNITPPSSIDFHKYPAFKYVEF